MAKIAALSADQRRIRDALIRIGRQRGATTKEIKAAIETGLVESGLRNLPGGDRDSAGWRQERASLYPDPTNLEASINRFYDETAAVRDKYPTAGALAAAVQRPAAQYRGRYQQVSGQADALLGGAGGGGGTTRTVTTTTPGVDNRAARASLISSFLEDKGADVLDFALQARALRDVPATTSTRTTRSRAGGGGGISGGKSDLLELIHRSASGPGYAVKNGQLVSGPEVYGSVWQGHADHVHFAAGRKTIVKLGRLAQRMGLRVGENPHFGGVSAVHVPGSYHYKGEAIDVSGDPTAMDRYASAVERLYGLRRSAG
jgi:hypothetical protein